jgi:hypothetical protein
MPTDGDKIAAATITAALLQPAQSGGDVGGMDRIHTAAAKRAAALYREILAAIQDPAATAR